MAAAPSRLSEFDFSASKCFRQIPLTIFNIDKDKSRADTDSEIVHFSALQPKGFASRRLVDVLHLLCERANERGKERMKKSRPQMISHNRAMHYLKERGNALNVLDKVKAGTYLER